MSPAMWLSMHRACDVVNCSVVASSKYRPARMQMMTIAKCLPQSMRSMCECHLLRCRMAALSP